MDPSCIAYLNNYDSPSLEYSSLELSLHSSIP